MSGFGDDLVEDGLMRVFEEGCTILFEICKESVALRHRGIGGGKGTCARSVSVRVFEEKIRETTQRASNAKPP